MAKQNVPLAVRNLSLKRELMDKPLTIPFPDSNVGRKTARKTKTNSTWTVCSKKVEWACIQAGRVKSHRYTRTPCKCGQQQQQRSHCDKHPRAPLRLLHPCHLQTSPHLLELDSTMHNSYSTLFSWSIFSPDTEHWFSKSGETVRVRDGWEAQALECLFVFKQ